MPENDHQNRDAYLWRGGRKIALRKQPDRFTVRLRRGATPEHIEAEGPVDLRAHLDRQNLHELSVEAENLEAAMERARSNDEVAFASHVYAFEQAPEDSLYLMDEITVQFVPEAGDAEIEALIAPHGLELLRPVEGVERTFVFRVTEQATENPIKIANRLAEEALVEASEPNLAVRQQSLHTPTDSQYRHQWHLHHDGGISLRDGSHIDVQRAWDLTRGERGIVVAVADDSVDLAHDDFQGAGKIVAPVDFKGQDLEPLPEAADDNHGTACAAVAVAEENNAGTVGVAPGCALMPIRTTGFIDDGSIENLCDWVIDRGASVLSASWSAAPRFFPLSIRMRAALHRAATVGRNGLGCVLVFAAGNENRPIDGTVDEQGWPGNSPSGATHWLNGFAAHPDVIAVAASSSLRRKSAYSNWGPEISVCAPSNNVRAPTFPRVTVATPGRGVVTADRVGPAGYSSTDFTFSFGGTSSACPVVAGLAGLVLSANPELAAAEVREILEGTADKIEDPDPDPQLGNRFGTYDAQGRCHWFGFGKVNAFRAVQGAIDRRGTAGETVEHEASPGLAIPDDDADGVNDQIEVPQQGRLRALRVDVDVPHTFIGDLRVVLTSPAGTLVVLHDRNGGSANDLRRAYNVDSTPALAALAGERIQGTWTLRVQDLAGADTGRLERWALAFELESSAVIELEAAPGLAIPDDDPQGIESTLEVDQDGTVASVEVSVDITHTFVGDLEVGLTSPSGQAVDLHRRTGGSDDNLVTTFTPATTPGLQVLRGTPARGDWRLAVADRAGLDVGKLNRWGLTVALG